MSVERSSKRMNMIRVKNLRWKRVMVVMFSFSNSFICSNRWSISFLYLAKMLCFKGFNGMWKFVSCLYCPVAVSNIMIGWLLHFDRTGRRLEHLIDCVHPRCVIIWLSMVDWRLIFLWCFCMVHWSSIFRLLKIQMPFIICRIGDFKAAVRLTWQSSDWIGRIENKCLKHGISDNEIGIGSIEHWTILDRIHLVWM